MGPRGEVRGPVRERHPCGWPEWVGLVLELRGGKTERGEDGGARAREREMEAEGWWRRPLFPAAPPRGNPLEGGEFAPNLPHEEEFAPEGNQWENKCF